VLEKALLNCVKPSKQRFKPRRLPAPQPTETLCAAQVYLLMELQARGELLGRCWRRAPAEGLLKGSC